MKENLVIVRGGGDLATGVIQKLHHCGFKVLVLETDLPTAIRRKVSFSEAIYDGAIQVEQDVATHIHTLDEAETVWRLGQIPVLVDPRGNSILQMKPDAVVDAIIAKRNLGTYIEMAPKVIGLGPGFVAGEDVHVVVETSRGHDLGRLIYHGSAAPNTGTPGIIQGVSRERVIYAPASGRLTVVSDIGEIVKKDAVIATIEGTVPVRATVDGVIRGMLRNGFSVQQGLKMADIDPRITEQKNCYTISDKARCLAGAVLEAILAK
jgi:xanthine dehydrogenase accessory factor